MTIAPGGRAEGTGKGAEGAVWINGVVHGMTVACDVIVFEESIGSIGLLTLVNLPSPLGRL